MREGHGTRGPRGMDTMGEAGERGQKKAVRYPCSAIVGPVAAGGPPGETHRGRLRGLRHWAAGCSGASAALCARGQAPRPEEPKTAYHGNYLRASRSSKRDSFRAFSRRYTWEQDEGLAPRSEIVQTAHRCAGPGPRRKCVCACF
ncbi:unnamed protein product [Prorocentrum cordatum]|uniref:Uncharacterized protein n=1 Tax=Prorocentrum cordatum TaxID=2364126 RepID=A0ABN9YB83_9DINO|nr:unnamed protein product [Polarella glacialis]